MMNSQIWDKRNRLVESRITATNALLGSYVYNERGLRVKAERSGQPMVQVVKPNGGESLYLGALDTISWNSTGLTGYVKLELLVNGEVAGTIAESVPAAQASYRWQVGKTLTGSVNPGADYKVRVSSLAPPPIAGTTYYFYDSGGKMLSEYDQTGACVKDYLYLGGKMIGEYQSATSSYYYYASDQINSTRLVTDATGTVVHSAQYDPYGGLYKTWVDSYHPKPGFSGKERETGSDLDYFGARYYGHKQYRFISVDPEINKNKVLPNPQFWNLYAYCDNNPINFIDPDGRDNGSLVEYRVREEWKKSYGETRADQFSQGVNHAYFVGGVVGGLIIGGAVLAIATEAIIPATIGAEEIAAKYGDKIQRSLEFTNHALERLAKRNIGIDQVNSIIQRIQPFKYFHEGFIKLGYYDAEASIFVATCEDKILTVIDNVKPKYIETLKNTMEAISK